MSSRAKQSQGMVKMNSRSIVDTNALSLEDISRILELSAVLKAAAEDGAVPQLLSGMVLALMFDSRSTRSRLSYDAAMASLGGTSVYLPVDTLHMGSGMETVRDTAHVVSTMVDGIAMRAVSQSIVDEMAQEATIPVLSAMGADGLHPAQALADLLTIKEHLPGGKPLAEVSVMLLGDTTNDSETADCVFSSLFRLLPRFGIRVVACSPRDFGPTDAFVRWINEDIAREGGFLQVIEDPYELVGQMDFIYAGAWVYYGDGHTRDAAERIFLPRYQLNGRLLDAAPDTCKIMHYMPGNRGLEVTDDVWDSSRSLLVQEAANRLAVARGMLAWALFPRRRLPSNELKRSYREHALELLEY